MKLLKNIFFTATQAVDSVRRDVSHLQLKMDLFVAKYPGKVIGKAIPIMASHQGIEEDNDGPIKYYVRIEYSSGVTSFAWFHTLIGAEKYLLRESDPSKKYEEYPDLKVTGSTGPHELPWGKNDRFM